MPGSDPHGPRNHLATSLDTFRGQGTLYTAINYSGTARTRGNGRTNYVGDTVNNHATAVVFKP